MSHLPSASLINREDGLLPLIPITSAKLARRLHISVVFWSGCAQFVKHGLELMGIGLIDIDAKDCMMLIAHQSLSNKELSLRNKTMVDFYIGVIKRYRKKLFKLSTLIVADAYFSTSTFVNGIKKEGFSLISRFRDNACLFYVYAGPRSGKRGRPKTKDGKIDMKNLDLTRMEKMEMEDIEETAYTLIAYSKALRCKVRLVIWQMPNGKKKLFFSTDTSSLIISLSKTLRTIMRTVCSSCTMTKLTWNHSFTLASCTYLLIFLCPV